MALAARVIAPLPVRTRPSTRVFAPTVMSAVDITVPANFEVAPIVVAPATVQNTLHAWASPNRATVVDAATDSAPPI